MILHKKIINYAYLLANNSIYLQNFIHISEEKKKWRWGVVVGREWNKGEGVEVEVEEVEDVIGERGADK